MCRIGVFHFDVVYHRRGLRSLVCTVLYIVPWLVLCTSHSTCPNSSLVLSVPCTHHPHHYNSRLAPFSLKSSERNCIPCLHHQTSPPTYENTRSMLPPIDPLVLQRNLNFEFLYKDLTTRKLNTDASTRDTKMQRVGDEMRKVCFWTRLKVMVCFTLNCSFGCNLSFLAFSSSRVLHRCSSCSSWIEISNNYVFLPIFHIFIISSSSST